MFQLARGIRQGNFAGTEFNHVTADALK